MAQWGTVHVAYGPVPDGPSGMWRFVDSDFEWAVKMAYHEPAPPSNLKEAEAVLWTVTQRWVGPPRPWQDRRSHGQENETFGEFAQRFSQPINLRQIGKVHGSPGSCYYDYRCTEQRYDPDACLSAEGGEAGSEACAMARSRARSQRIIDNRKRPLSWYEEHAPGTVDLVRRFMLGQVPNKDFPGWTDFAARHVRQQSGDTRVRYPGISDSFYREDWAKDWTVDTVKIYPPGAEMQPRPKKSGARALVAVLGSMLLMGSVVVVGGGLGSARKGQKVVRKVVR